MSEPLDVSKLKVPELRAELSKRGLNTFGTRQILVERLCEAMGTTSEPGKTTECDEPPTITSVALKGNSQERPEEVPSRRSSFENGVTDQAVESDAHSKSETDYKRKRSPSRSPRRRSRSRDRDSRRSPRRRSRSPASSTKMVEEAVGWENSASVFLDSYNCDLSLILDAEGFNAKPLTDGGFSMMWSGVRANYGFINGKAFYEVKNVRHIPVENLDSMTGGAAHVMRVGWSTESADLALGEEPQSFGYGGTAKKSTNNKFSNYGCTFDEGDVVGAFIEWTSSEAVMRFSVNGVDQGECFRVQKSTLGERFALFPHIYVKNVEFSVNFGQDGMPPWFPPNVPNSDPMSWLQLNNVNISYRAHGRMPPASKAECEVIMMIGLPGAGKTYYAERLRADNREKQYTVLGTNLILDKMKVCGLSRQRNYHGRWDVLIDKATKCLNTLMSIASRRRRNYILDQTNVYPSAQRRKMRPFEGFKRKAIVIVPTDEEFRRRIAQREKEEGKEVPESAVLEMKANFEIPKPLSEDSSSVFGEVLFTELNSAEANDLVQKYNQEGQANRPPPEKRQRWEGSRDRESSDSRFHGGHANRDRGRDYGRGRRDDFRRSPDRRDDRGRREYRGGYNAERDRSRDSDRYDRGRDRESYSRPNDRFGGGPPSRFGGPPNRGGYPPSMGPGGGYGGYGAPRGGGGMVMRGGRGAPYGNGMTRGYGNPYDAAPPMDFRGSDGRPPRGGRGGYRGGTNEVGYGGPMDSVYGGPQGHYDSSTGKGGPVDTYGTGNETTPAVVDSQPPPDGVVGGGGYRGGYGPPTRGSYGGAPDASGYNARGPYGGAPDAGGYNTRGSYGGAPDTSNYGTRGSYGGAPDASSYSTRGSYGGAPDAGGYSARGGVGSAPPRGGRAGAHMDRESAPMGRGGAPLGRGTPFVRGGSGGRGGYPSSARGGYQGDQDSASGYSVGSSDRTQSYSSYPPSVPADTYGAGSAPSYPVTEDYSDRSRDRYSASTTGPYGAPAQQPKPAGGYSGSGPGGYSSGYQRSGPPSYPGSGQSGYASGYPPEGASGYPTANYPASDNLGSSEGSRGGRSGRGMSGPQATTTRPYSSAESDKGAQDTQSTDRQPSDPGSLYASGAARYGETRANATPQPSGPKQSRFDNKPAPTGQQSYSNYPPTSYPTGYGSGYGAGPMSANPPAPTNAPPGLGGARSARSRFDVGPGSNPSPASTGGSQSSLPQQPTPAQQQMPSSQTGQASQQYGYAYASQGTKPDPSSAQPTASAQASYSYGYGYGGYGGGYGGQQSQPSQPTTAQSRSNTSATSVAPSLYASAVADKPQTSTAQTPVASAQSSSATDASAALAAAAYASYYGYGATTAPGAAPASGTSQPPTTGAMAAAQQFNAWQQQSAGGPTAAAATTTPSVTTPQQGSAATAYGSYYPGYSAYAAGYGTTNPSQTAPAAPSAQTMPQYYSGYR